jgi:hypothetical protein
MATKIVGDGDDTRFPLFWAIPGLCEIESTLPRAVAHPATWEGKPGAQPFWAPLDMR